MARHSSAANGAAAEQDGQPHSDAAGGAAECRRPGGGAPGHRHAHEHADEAQPAVNGGVKHDSAAADAHAHGSGSGHAHEDHHLHANRVTSVSLRLPEALDLQRCVSTNELNNIDR